MSVPALPLGRKARWGLLAAAAGALAVLATARWLEPSPLGYGTHMQLGLLPCSFRRMTGYSCPTCGMTTSFAWFARGRAGPAWRANPVGLLLAASLLALVPWLIAGALTGRAWGVRSLERPLVVAVGAFVGLSLLAWALRMLV